MHLSDDPAEDSALESEQIQSPQPERKRLRIVPSRLVRRNIAIVDDDEDIQLYLRDTLSDLGYSVWCFGSAESFLEHLKIESKENPPDSFDCPFDVILCDVRLPGRDGLSLVQILRKLTEDVPIVLMTAYAEIENAVQAIKEGAYDYLQKPFELSRLTLVIENALQIRALNIENQFLRASGAAGLKLYGVVSQSPAMQAIYDLIKRVAPTDSSVLITGENGVGKEVIARALHDNSDRAEKPFVSINCSTIPESLLESELFGHTKGSFTSATEHRKGIFEEADGGTLFLDEIGDLDLSLQVKLLRVLQEKKIRAVGDNHFRSVDVRIVSATHKNLAAEIKMGRFREDLFYRLSVIPVHIPPLRQRKEDILALARAFLSDSVKRNGLAPKTFTPEALSTLAQLPWKGNVRELQNVIERSVVMSSGDKIDEGDLPVVEGHELEEFISELSEDFPSLKDVEKSYLLSVLRKLNGKKEAAAKVLGMSRRTLYRKLTKFDSDKPRTH